MAVNRWNLNPVRLPVPPHPHIGVLRTIVAGWTQLMAAARHGAGTESGREVRQSGDGPLQNFAVPGSWDSLLRSVDRRVDLGRYNIRHRLHHKPNVPSPKMTKPAATRTDHFAFLVTKRFQSVIGVIQSAYKCRRHREERTAYAQIPALWLELFAEVGIQTFEF